MEKRSGSGRGQEQGPGVRGPLWNRDRRGGGCQHQHQGADTAKPPGRSPGGICWQEEGSASFPKGESRRLGRVLSPLTPPGGPRRSEHLRSSGKTCQEHNNFSGAR